MSQATDPQTTRIPHQLREMLISGEVAPGEKLSEQRLAQGLGTSRNTLREAFRTLAAEGLLIHHPNRGVFVAAPDEAAIVDIYRLRRIVQRGAVEAAVPGHPALVEMAECVRVAEQARAAGDWRAVATQNMAYHRAMVRLCDSPRLSAGFDSAMAEMRLAFGRIEDAAFLHEPYIELNDALLRAMLRGNRLTALAQLEAYLQRSEQAILGAFARLRATTGSR